MKTIEVKYNADGYIREVSDNSVHFEQENNSLQIIAQIFTDKKVRAYIKSPNNNTGITDEMEPFYDHMYSCTVGSDYMAKGTLYVGYELYDDNGYIERLEPLKIYVDSFVNLGGDSSDNVYVVTVKVGEVETLATGQPATVENVGTKKDMILNFGLPKGDKGEKGDKGDKGDMGPQGAQGVQGIQGVPGKEGYTPQKGVDYFTDEDIASLGINEKADKNWVVDLESSILRNEEAIWDLQNNKADSNLAFDGFYDVSGYQADYTEAIYKARNGFVIQRLTGYSESTDYYGVEQFWHNGYLVYGRILGDEEGWQNDWKSASATITDIYDAIGNIETSLDNIIKKYGLGGDGV